jgi:hypothetical protein
VTWNRSILHFRRPFSYRDCIYDLTSAGTAVRGMAGSTNTSLRTKMPNELFFKGATSLYEQAFVDGLV